MNESVPGPKKERASRLPLVALITMIGATDAQSEAPDSELARIAHIGPACTALIQSPAGSDVSACKTELLSTAEALKQYAARGSFSETTLLSGRISNKELCERGARLLEEHEARLSHIIEYLSTLVMPEGGDIVSEKLAKGVVGDIRRTQGSVTPESYRAVVAEKLKVARENLVSCGIVLRTIISAGGLSKARSEIQTKVPILIDQLIHDIQQVQDVERLKKATVALVKLLEIVRSAARE